MKLYLNKIFNFALITLFLFFGFINSAAYGVTTLGVSCTPPVAVANWPRNVFSSTCTITVTRTTELNLKVGIYATAYNTTRIGGTAGPSPINYRTPENPIYRFQANGPLQGGTPANINTATTVAGGILLVKNGISVNDVFDVPITYTTYEADIGGTIYRQQFRVRLFLSNNNTSRTTAAQNYDFTIANRQYVTISAPPVVTLANSNQVFTTGQYYDSNNYTVSVSANNTWALQTRLVTNPTSGGDTLPVTSQYFRCAADANFTCSATARTQYAVANTYYNMANNTAGVYSTGTADNINLSSRSVSITNSLLNSSVFTKGDYTTTIDFNVHSPNP